MQLLIINGVDLTPYITLKGYHCSIEDLDASAERNMAGGLTRDRVARVPVIDVSFKAMLKQADVTKILNALKPSRFQARYYNSETGSLETGFFYSKTKHPRIYSTAGNVIRYEAFSASLKGFEGVDYD